MVLLVQSDDLYATVFPFMRHHFKVEVEQYQRVDLYKLNLPIALFQIAQGCS